MKNDYGHELNNGRRRRTARANDRTAEYEREWSLDANDRRDAEVKDRRAAIQINNQRILDGIDASRERRKSGVYRAPRHIRRRPLQAKWHEANA